MRFLDRTKTQNTKLTQQITQLSKKNPQEKQRQQRNRVTIQTPQEESKAMARQQRERPKSTQARQ